MICEGCSHLDINVTNKASYLVSVEVEHKCLADVNRCVDGKDCPDYIDHCCCKQCYN